MCPGIQAVGEQRWPLRYSQDCGWGIAGRGRDGKDGCAGQVPHAAWAGCAYCHCSNHWQQVSRACPGGGLQPLVSSWVVGMAVIQLLDDAFFISSNHTQPPDHPLHPRLQKNVSPSLLLPRPSLPCTLWRVLLSPSSSSSPSFWREGLGLGHL